MIGRLFASLLKSDANELLVLYDGKTRFHGKPDSEPNIEPDPVLAGKRFIDEYRFHGNGGATG